LRRQVVCWHVVSPHSEVRERRCREWRRLTRHAGMGTISDCAKTEAVEQRRERAREKVRDFIVVVVVVVVVVDERASRKRR